MSLPAIRGHHEARSLLARLTAGGNPPQSLLLFGPAGIGKERLGLWFAQTLVCEQPSEDGPCGSCQPCRLVERLEHPDVHWFFPLPRPDASSPEKLREKLEDARAVELQHRRESPGYLPAFERAPAHFLAAILTLQQLAAVRPALARRKVFVVGDAELMVPQESSPEAANAFLKLLEEPPADTFLIITSSHPGALLPTVRSRVLPLRLKTLEEAEVLDFLEGERISTGASAARAAGLSRGSIGRALQLIPVGGDAGPLEQRRQIGREWLLATLSDSAVPRLALAHKKPPAGARGEFAAELEAFAEWLRDLMAVAGGAADDAIARDDAALLQRGIDRWKIGPVAVAAALLDVTEAQESARGNVNPQLILSDLLRRVQARLRAQPI